MKLIVQQVSHASVTANHLKICHIGPGYLVLVGIEPHDNPKTITHLSQKLLHTKLMPTHSTPFSQSILESQGEILVVPQFTLLARVKGTHLSFSHAAKTPLAQKIYQDFVQHLQLSGLAIKTGKFGAFMQVSLTNSGPITLILEK